MARGFIEPGEKPRRFYKDVTVAPADGGFGVRLDGRELRAPKGAPLVLPTQALADMVADVGLTVLDSDPYLGFVHRVDQAIVRDLLVAQKPA